MNTNKKWIFSGVGIASIGVLFGFVRRKLLRRKPIKVE